MGANSQASNGPPLRYAASSILTGGVLAIVTCIIWAVRMRQIVKVIHQEDFARQAIELAREARLAHT
jgi:hypothetical protein